MEDTIRESVRVLGSMGGGGGVFSKVMFPLIMYLIVSVSLYTSHDA